MDKNKIIRTICEFSDKPGDQILTKLEEVEAKLKSNNFEVQTKRICTSTTIKILDDAISDSSIYCSVGTLSKSDAIGQLPDFFKAKNMAFNTELSGEKITKSDSDLLFQIIRGVGVLHSPVGCMVKRLE